VERLKQQGAEDEQVQRALRKIDREGIWFPSPITSTGRYASSCRSARGEGRRETGMLTALKFDQ
jgi:hypothetical protein